MQNTVFIFQKSYSLKFSTCFLNICTIKELIMSHDALSVIMMLITAEMTKNA